MYWGGLAPPKMTEKIEKMTDKIGNSLVKNTWHTVLKAQLEAVCNPDFNGGSTL